MGIFPPFTGFIRRLILANLAVFFGLLLLNLAAPAFELRLAGHLILMPEMVMHGQVWQIVTYSFIHIGFWHWFGNMLGLWMFGSAIEGAWGTRRFVELFSVGVIGAAITTIALAYAHVLGSPLTPTLTMRPLMPG